MGIEQTINYQLNKYPVAKKFIKRAYQYTMYGLSKKIKSEGSIQRMTPIDDNYEYFFGYYDKSPWDATEQYMLCLRVKKTWDDVSPKDVADIVLIDTSLSESDPKRIRKLAESHSWNVQQGCMLQWLGPDYKERIIYNDCREGRYCSIVLNVLTGEERIIEMPVYTVASDGTFALTLDFSRLYNLRPGYGYYNIPEKTKDVALPDATAIWYVDLFTGESKPLLTYVDFSSFMPRPEMMEEGSVHKVNHLMLNPDNQRFMVLYRWFNGHRKYTRLITCGVDGTNMYVLSDDDMVSHCFWQDNEHILAYENKSNDGPGYYLMKDKTQEYIHCWPELSSDGHPSYSPDRKYVVTDTYPDRARISKIKIMEADSTKDKVYTVAKVFSPFRYDNDTRCDLHPRWNRRGNKICFDSVFEGKRGLYVADVSAYVLKTGRHDIYEQQNTIESPLFSIITPVYNSYKFMKRYFDSLKNQTYDNFEVILVDDGSTDGSAEQITSFLKEYPIQTKLIKLERNSGPGCARNAGMKEAKGKWITFIDNDDWVDEHLLEHIVSVISAFDVNCVVYDYFISNGINNKVGKSLYSGKRGLVPLSNAVMYTRNHVIGKFYKRICLETNNVEFPTLRRCEDVAFVARALDACGTIFYLDEPLYYYYQREGSLSNNHNLDEKDLIKAFNIIEESLGEKYPREIAEKSVPDLLYGGVLTMCKAEKSINDINDFVDMYSSKYPFWYTFNIANMLGKSKLVFLKCIRYKQYHLVKCLSSIHSFIVRKF